MPAEKSHSVAVRTGFCNERAPDTAWVIYFVSYTLGATSGSSSIVQMPESGRAHRASKTA